MSKLIESKLSEFEQIIEADKKRTPGDWYQGVYSSDDPSPMPTFYSKELSTGYRTYAIGSTQFQNRNFDPTGERHIVDAGFICLAANNLARLARENALMLKALDIINEQAEISGVNCDTRVARLALAEVLEEKK